MKWTPEEINHPEWIVKRSAILIRDHATCKWCGVQNVPLRVHHLKYGPGAKWEVPDEWLVTLCLPCHDKAHPDKTPLAVDYFPKVPYEYQFAMPSESHHGYRHYIDGNWLCTCGCDQAVTPMEFVGSV